MNRVGVIGVGRWGSRLAKRASILKDTRVDVVVDDNADAGRRVADELGCQYSPWIDDIGYCDAVSICTPPSSDRVEIIRRVAGIGIAQIRVEKPIGLSAKECQQLVDIEYEYGVTITPGLTPLYDDAFDLLREYSDDWSATEFTSFRTGNKRPAHEVSIAADLCIHDAAIHNYVTGDVFSVAKAISSDVVALEVFTAGGVHRGGIAGGYGDKPYRVHFLSGDGHSVEYDEVSGVMRLDGRVVYTREFDPLGRELKAWLGDSAYGLSVGVDAVSVLGDYLLDVEAMRELCA